MNQKKIQRVVLLWAVMVALLVGGCSGCFEGVLDAVDDRLSADPERPGKVGTLRALEVAKVARQVGDRQLDGEGLCEIGWETGEAAAVDFSLEIEVEDSSHRRSWIEQGSWQRDDDGRFHIEVDIEFSDGDEVDGNRWQRVFYDEEGFWEWLGPELVVRHAAKSEAKQGWQREFAGRFLGLLALTSATWEEASEQGEGQKLWTPGGSRRLCGPAITEGEVQSWRPLLGARVAQQSTRVRAVERESGDEAGMCRYFVGDYRLETGAVMKVQFQECSARAPQRLERPKAQRYVEVGRDRSRTQAASQLESWIRDEIVDAVKWDETP